MRSFVYSERGSITILWLLLIPAMLLVGGFATDISMINAQKRYVQSQADLAAQSAARHLPNLSEARTIAQEVVSANDKYGNVPLGSTDVTFGSFDSKTGTFTAAPVQTDPTGVTAVKVSVPSNFAPFLLAPVMQNGNYVIRRSGVAARRGAISFTLRNRLLGIDTSRSILDPLLNDGLGLGVSAKLLDYSGLANTEVGINQLLGLVSSRIGLDAVSYEDLLKAPIALDTLIGGLTDLNGLPTGVSSNATNTVSLGSLLALSPNVLQAEIGQVLPDIKLNVFDLLAAIVSVDGSNSGVDLVNVPLSLQIPHLAAVDVVVSAIHPAVTALGFIDDVPPVEARLAQLHAKVKTELAGIVSVGLDLHGGGATATAQTLNCGAISGNDTLATFDVKTAALKIKLTTSLLNLINGKSLEQSASIPVLGDEQTISVRKDQVGKAITIQNNLHLSTITTALSDLLVQLQQSTTDEKTSCGLLSCLLGPILDLVNGIISALNSILANLGFLDDLVNGLLSALGVSVAQADLIVNDYTCTGTLVQ
ncbi:pilus assembly protein TadG-related protein [Thioclava sp. JE_KL1]|uniref:pilus assembly protein TadG-related protein n=1 Tax=Thioclava sp. JE_KL1 TaxID=2651187 RepID=UPI00128CD9D9|nr:pilus assembly protein TadG-related protein [Thioclava sp. JE_KL1]MPQ95998.1 hypothetical protein [Thioclava sp. JE_KL1]